MLLKPKSNDTQVDDKLAKRADGEWKTIIDNVLQSHEIAGRVKVLIGGYQFNLCHKTQSAANRVVFYIWQNNVMEVWGLGEHTTSNKDYSVLWYTGKTGQVHLP